MTNTAVAAKLQAWYPVLDFVHRGELYQQALDCCEEWWEGLHPVSEIEAIRNGKTASYLSNERTELLLQEWEQVNQLFARFVAVYHPETEVQPLSAYDIDLPSPVERGLPGPGIMEKIGAPCCSHYFSEGYTELQFWVGLLQSKTATELTEIVTRLQAVEHYLDEFFNPSNAGYLMNVLLVELSEFRYPRLFPLQPVGEAPQTFSVTAEQRAELTTRIVAVVESLGWQSSSEA